MSPRQQRCAVAAAIVGAHVMAVLLLCYGDRLLQFATGHPAEEPLLYVMPLPAAPPLPSAVQGPLHVRPSAAGAITLPAPATSATPAAPAALTPPEQARIHWDLEAEVAADEWVDELARHEARKCDDSDKPGSWLPKCKKKPSSYEWNAEPKRAGFENGLPYVRLGKRCILILGMVGCALGDAPPANGHLLDDLKDPDRDRSSVPDIADINEPADAAPPHPSVVMDPARSGAPPR